MAAAERDARHCVARMSRYSLVCPRLDSAVGAGPGIMSPAPAASSGAQRSPSAEGRLPASRGDSHEKRVGADLHLFGPELGEDEAGCGLGFGLEDAELGAGLQVDHDNLGKRI